MGTFWCASSLTGRTCVCLWTGVSRSQNDAALLRRGVTFDIWELETQEAGMMMGLDQRRYFGDGLDFVWSHCCRGKWWRRCVWDGCVWSALKYIDGIVYKNAGGYFTSFPPPYQQRWTFVDGAFSSGSGLMKQIVRLVLAVDATDSAFCFPGLHLQSHCPHVTIHDQHTRVPLSWASTSLSWRGEKIAFPQLRSQPFVNLNDSMNLMNFIAALCDVHIA